MRNYIYSQKLAFIRPFPFLNTENSPIERKNYLKSSNQKLHFCFSHGYSGNCAA